MLVVVMLATIAAGAAWLASSGDSADHRAAFLAIGFGSLGWATATLSAWLPHWPEPVATRALVGASTACMLVLLVGVAALLVGLAL